MKHYVATPKSDVGEKGELVFKLVIVRVFTPGNKDSFVMRHKARAGHVITQAAVDILLDRVTDQVDKRFPDDEFRFVDLGDAHFNFVWHAKREAPGTQERAEA